MDYEEGIVMDWLGSDGDPEDTAQCEVVKADASNLTWEFHVCTVDAQHKASSHQQGGQADVGHRMFHFLGNADRPDNKNKKMSLTWKVHSLTNLFSL